MAQKHQAQKQKQSESSVKFYRTQDAAYRAMMLNNMSLTRQAFHKYFKVMIDGPDDNYAAVDFRTAREMGVSYRVGF